MTDETLDSEEMEAEIERLRAKNAELLTELKAAKAKAGELEGLREQLEEVRLKKPVHDLLGKLLASKSAYSIAEFEEHFTFALNDAGEIQMHDAEGQPVMITETVDGADVVRPIRADEDEIWRYLADDYQKLNHIVRSSGRSGTGAPPASRTRQHSESKPRPAKGAEFGLR